jgi:medium-chain acyl-[acyl-carrier-protein] hydrolase
MQAYSRPDPVRPEPGGASLPRLRLFCFPYSGASASVFFPWRGAFGPEIEVVPVELPGRGTRMTEPLATRIETLVERFARELRPQLDRPYAFFGHSMGALLAFELARRLEKEDGGPVHFFASGHVAPQVRERDEVWHTLPEAELLDMLRTLNGTPEEVLQNPELRELILPILRADFEICDEYRFRPGEPLRCSITAFGGLGDEEVSRENLDAWREHTRGSFKLRMFSGGHFFISSAKHDVLLALGRELRELAEAQR